MKKSQNIKLGIVTAVALAACNPTEVKHCIDADGNVVEDSKCDPVNEPDGGSSNTVPFRWYYGGTGGRTYSPGTRIVTSGGSYTPNPGRSYSSPSGHTSGSPGSIGRGGFGGIGHGTAGE